MNFYIIINNSMNNEFYKGNYNLNRTIKNKDFFQQSKILNDLTKDNYQKYKSSYIDINSKNDKYIFNKIFNNISSIKLHQINIIPLLINSSNNQLKWILPANNIDCNDINKDVLEASETEYSVKITNGNYTLNKLVNEIENKMNQKMINISLISSQTFNFKCNINPVNNNVSFYNKLENIQISMMSTYLNQTDNRLSTLITTNPNSIYIFITNSNFTNIFDNNNRLPIILHDLPSIGGISKESINNIEFYLSTETPVGYLGNTYEIKSPIDYYNEYSYINKLYCIQLNFSNLKIKFSENILFDDLLLNTNSNINEKQINLSQLINQINTKKKPVIGRGYYFKFIIDDYSILNNLGWNKDCNEVYISNKCPYQTIQKNIDFIIEEKSQILNNNYVYQNILYPTGLFKFEKIYSQNDYYILSSYDYIYINIKLDDFEDIIKFKINNSNYERFYIFNEKTPDNISSIEVYLTNPNNIKINLEYSFTLEIQEIITNLKNTMFNSKINKF